MRQGRQVTARKLDYFLHAVLGHRDDLRKSGFESGLAYLVL